MCKDSQDKPLVEVKNTMNVSVLGKEADKATAEILKAALGPLASETGNLLANLVGIVGDRVSAARQQNSIGVLEGARVQLEADGVDLIDVTPLSIGDADRLIVGASQAYEAELQSLWSGLIASALNPEKPQDPDAAHVAILKQMSQNDALAFDLIHGLEQIKVAEDLEYAGNVELHGRFSRQSEGWKQFREKYGKLKDDLVGRVMSSRDLPPSPTNLIRLGLVRFPTEKHISEQLGAAQFRRIGDGTRNYDERTAGRTRELSDRLRQEFDIIRRSLEVIEDSEFFEATAEVLREDQEGHPSSSYVLTTVGWLFGAACGLNSVTEAQDENS